MKQSLEKLVMTPLALGLEFGQHLYKKVSRLTRHLNLDKACSLLQIPSKSELKRLELKVAALEKRLKSKRA